MGGSSKKRDQAQSTSSNPNGGPPPASELEVEAPIPQEKGTRQAVVYERKRQKILTNRGKRPAQSMSNEQGPVEVGNDLEVPQEEQPKQKRRKVAENEGPRNRSSPARLFKLNKELVEDQHNLIKDIEFGGLLDIQATSMPGDLSQWIMKHYDPEMSQIIIPDRGKIPVDAESVRRIWGLPNKGRKVCFELNPDVISEFNSIYKIEGKNAPMLTPWCKMIEKMNGAADNDFLRAWLAVAFSCFLAPTTSLSISPRCYTAILDTNAIKETRICDFVVDQLRLAFMGFGDKKKAVCCCVFHLVILYLDSLEVDEPIPSMLPRASIWNDELIAKVMKKDKKGPGVYGKLRLKTEFSRCANDSLFGSMDHITKFVVARLLESFDKNKQNMLAGMVHEMCTEMSHAVGKLVFGIGKLDDGGAGTSANTHCTMGTSSQKSAKKGKTKPRVIEPNSTEEEESFNTDGESDEDEQSKDNESDSDKDKSGDSDEDDMDDDDENPQVGNTVQEEEEEEEDEGVGQAKQVDKDQGKGGDVSSTHEGDSSQHTKEVQGEEGSEKAKTEKEDEDEDEKKDDEQASERTRDDRHGNDEDDKDGGGGHNTSTHGNSDEDEPGASSGSTNEGDVSTEFFIKKTHSRANGADDPESISLVDIVRMEFKKEWKPMEGQKLQLPEVYDGRSTASFADMLFQRLLEGEDMQNACNFSLEKLCPQRTEEELMREICGLKGPVTETKGEPKSHVSSLPPRKQKRVSFNFAHTEATTLDPRHGSRPLVSALKHKGQTQKVGHQVDMKSEAAQVKVAATCMGVQAAQRTTEAYIGTCQGPSCNQQVARETGQPQDDLKVTSTACKQGSAKQPNMKQVDGKTKVTCTQEQASQASFDPKLPIVDHNFPATRPSSTHTSLVQNNSKLPSSPSKLMQNMKQVDGKTKVTCTQAQASQASFDPKLPTVDLNLPATRPSSTHTSLVQNNSKLPSSPSKLMQNMKELDGKTKVTCTQAQASKASFDPKLPTVDLKLPATRPSSTHTSSVQTNSKLPSSPPKLILNNIKLPQTNAKFPASIPSFSRQAFSEVREATSPAMIMNNDAKLPAKIPQLTTQPMTHAKPPHSVAQLLRTNLKLPTGSQQAAQEPVAELKEGTSVSELLKVDANIPVRSPKFSRPSTRDANKENCPPETHKDYCSSTVNIEEILAKCVVPATIQIKHPTAYIVEEPPEEPQDVPKLQGVCDEYCPTPSFGVIFDDLEPIFEETTKVSNQYVGTRSVNEPDLEDEVTEVINVEEDDWQAIEEACAAAERRSKETVGGQEGGSLSPNNYHTPIKVTSEIALGSDGKCYSSSSSGEPVTNQFERRVIKPPACLRSPFVDPDNKKEFFCKTEVNRLYASMILHARLSAEESQDIDNSPKIIDYNGYYVSLRELADSMKVEGVILSHVFEVGICSIMMNLPPDSKKVVMPLRFSIRLQQMTWNTQEINARFNKTNHLDRKDMIMFPILENIDPAKVKSGNHYWVFNLNIRDRRFEMLDSLRSLADVDLNYSARKIAATIRCMWDYHYGKSRVVLDDFDLVNIDVPRQNNDVDCGIYGLTNASKWVARVVPKYGPDDIPSIRKQLINKWVSSVHNKAPWKEILKLP